MVSFLLYFIGMVLYGKSRMKGWCVEMTLLVQSLGFGVVYGFIMLISNFKKPNKFRLALKYLILGTLGYFLYKWALYLWFS